LRALLDAHGLLDPARDVAFPPRDAAFSVFSQREDAQIDVAEWGRYAERFLRARVGLTVSKSYDARIPQRDLVRVVLAPAREGSSVSGGTRLCWGRPRTEEDLEAARHAEVAGAGLPDLAARCPQIWLVERESEDDLVALRIAAVVAGVMLGPILSSSAAGRSLFGPKTARERLGE
jgi:hypothetical protein